MNPYVMALALAGIGLYRRLDYDIASPSAYRFAKIPLQRGDHIFFMTRGPFSGLKNIGWELSSASPPEVYELCEWGAIREPMVRRLNEKATRQIINELVRA